jgi:hypothetical protein
MKDFLERKTVGVQSPNKGFPTIGGDLSGTSGGMESRPNTEISKYGHQLFSRPLHH